MMTKKQADSLCKKIAYVLGGLIPLIIFIFFLFIDPVFQTLKNNNVPLQTVVVIILAPIPILILIAFWIMRKIQKNITNKIIEGEDSNRVFNFTENTNNTFNVNKALSLPSGQLSIDVIPVLLIIFGAVSAELLLYILPNLLAYLPEPKILFFILLFITPFFSYLLKTMEKSIINEFTEPKRQTLKNSHEKIFERASFFKFISQHGSKNAIDAAYAYWKTILFRAYFIGFYLAIVVTSFFN